MAVFILTKAALLSSLWHGSSQASNGTFLAKGLPVGLGVSGIDPLKDGMRYEFHCPFSY
jgi:hypothetical protein